MSWLKVNGVDFNLDVAAPMTFEEFKNEFKHTFFGKSSDEELRQIWKQLRAANKSGEVSEERTPETERQIAFEPALVSGDFPGTILPEQPEPNGDTTTDKGKVSKASRKGS